LLIEISRNCDRNKVEEKFLQIFYASFESVFFVFKIIQIFFCKEKLEENCVDFQFLMKQNQKKSWKNTILIDRNSEPW